MKTALTPLNFARRARKLYGDLEGVIEAHSRRKRWYLTRVLLVNVTTQDSRVQKLIDQRFAYVSVSRAEIDAHIFADQSDKLAQALSRRQDKHQALGPEEVEVYRELLIKVKPLKQDQQHVALTTKLFVMVTLFNHTWPTPRFAIPPAPSRVPLSTFPLMLLLTTLTVPRLPGG